MILLSVLFLSLGSLEPSPSHALPAPLQISETPLSSEPNSQLSENIQTALHHLSKGAFYLGTGTALESVSLLARFGGQACSVLPYLFPGMSGAATLGNECLLLSQVCGATAKHLFRQLFKKSPSSPFLLENIPLSQTSWHLNQTLLSQIPATSDEDKQLLLFLQKRWLAKTTGFFSFVIDWYCPCFGISVQVHPETTNTYARDPSNKLSQTYQNKVQLWKASLPHPEHFPLILTRSHAVEDYLSPYFEGHQNETAEATAQRLALSMPTNDSNVIVDLTDVLTANSAWKSYLIEFSEACKKHHLPPSRILCIQRMQQEEMGGIRLLPLPSLNATQIEEQHQFLLHRISKFGLSANRVELDRCHLSSKDMNICQQSPIWLSEHPSKEKFLSTLTTFEHVWTSTHPQKNLMLLGTLGTLKGLLNRVSSDQWKEVTNNKVKSSVVQLSFVRIENELQLLEQLQSDISFFDTVSHVEQIHANLTALIEIFSPFTPGDFPLIYKQLLSMIPKQLKPLTSCGIHSSGMTSLSGILKAVEKTAEKKPRILYGENTYFENIYVANMVADAISLDDATEQDWQDVDLILAQFNPVLKRIDFQVTNYGVEKIADTLHRALISRQKPLTLAIDCTLDYLNSPRLGQLLTEFQDEIKKGTLNIICYRSGLKFDLFGMDNYCGAPFYMLHNRDAKWSAFDSLLTDPLLQTDRLSLNWFCLAYQNAAPHLERYRKEVFTNTRTLLNKIPSRLFAKQGKNYRVIPVEEDADPAFIDVKIYGPLHQVRGALVGGLFTLKCMEEKHPLFYRPSLGFYHPNCSMLYGKECTTIRLTLGLDPTQVDVLAKCFETINSLN